MVIDADQIMTISTNATDLIAGWSWNWSLISSAAMVVPEASQFSLAICFALSFFAARFLLDFFVFKVNYHLFSFFVVHAFEKKFMWYCCISSAFDQPLAAIVLKGDGAQSKVVKCSEAMWKLTCSASMQIWGASIILQEQTSWWTEQKEFFRGWPNQEMKWALHYFRILMTINTVHLDT